MKLSIRQTEKEYGTWKAEQIWQEIEAELEKQGLLLNYIIADGEEVWENFSEYLAERQGKLQTIEVMALTLAEYTAFAAGDLAAAAKAGAEEALRLSDSFYGEQESSEDWPGLSAIFEKVSADFAAVELLHSLLQAQPGREEQAAAVEELYSRLQADLKLFQKPLAEEDVIYIADLLHFELESDLRELARCCETIRD